MSRANHKNRLSIKSATSTKFDDLADILQELAGDDWVEQQWLNEEPERWDGME